jgi:hypothetical protein
MYEEVAYDICKISRQLMWPRRPSTLEVLNMISSFLSMVFVWFGCLGFFIGLLWCSTMSMRVGWIRIWWLWRWEQILQLGNFMLWFWWTIVVFSFIMVCYISFWLCMHVCMCCERIWMLWETIMRSLFWVLKHVLLQVLPPIVLFTRPYIVGFGVSFIHLLGGLLWGILKLKDMEFPK